MKKILNVTKVGFYGTTGDNRSPESAPFPACMTSLYEVLGETDCPNLIIESNGVKYTKRTANDGFVVATGMAFALLWEREYCMSALDLTQINEGYETVKLAFNWMGYDYKIYEHSNTDNKVMLDIIKKSIDNGIPVLGVGVIDPPECLIIAGYDQDSLLGYSHFQESLPKADNGMFVLKNLDDWWYFIVPGAKTKSTLTSDDIIRNGIKMLEKREIEGYAAGQSAYDEWVKSLSSAANVDENERNKIMQYHHNIMFSLAEMRAWGANYFRNSCSVEVANHFQKIHDLCWEAEGVTGGINADALLDETKRNKVIDIVNKMRNEDLAATKELKKILESK